jgi:asparagine synthase (glutamine-hydrolysing)
MVLLKVDRASMHNSLEVRVPLLDREVIDVAARIDWRTCLDLAGGTGKQPLRQALRRHTAYQTQPKRGFTIPMDAWLRGPLHDVFADMLLGRRELLGMALNQAALEQALRDHVHGTADRGASLWTLLSLAFWHDRQLQPARAQAGAMTPALA